MFPIQLAIQIFYSILLFGTYFILFRILLRRKYRQFYIYSFYRLFLALCAVNLIYVFDSYIILRLTAWDYLQDFYLTTMNSCPVIPFLLEFVAFNCGPALNFTQCLIAFNRCTAVVFPFGFVKFWNYALPISYVIIFILPLTITAYQIGIPFFFVYSSYFNRTMLTWNPPKPTPSSYSINFRIAIPSMVCLVLSALFNLITLYFLYRRRLIGNPDPKNEIRLIAITMTVFISQLATAICNMGVYLDTTYAWAIFFLANGTWLTDIFTLTNPLTLLGCSPQVRQHFMQIVRPWKKKKPLTVQQRFQQQQRTPSSLAVIS